MDSNAPYSFTDGKLMVKFVRYNKSTPDDPESIVGALSAILEPGPSKGKNRSDCNCSGYPRGGDFLRRRNRFRSLFLKQKNRNNIEFIQKNGGFDPRFFVCFCPNKSREFVSGFLEATCRREARKLVFAQKFRSRTRVSGVAGANERTVGNTRHRCSSSWKDRFYIFFQKNSLTVSSSLGFNPSNDTA